MSLSMYQASIPVFIKYLTNLSGILKKAEAHAQAKKIEPEVLLNSRLIADMYPLSRQVQIAADVVKGGGARLAGVDVPSYPDTEKTFLELQARITKTVDFLNNLQASQIDGSEDRKIILKVGGNDMHFQGQSYLLTFVQPNLYFHLSMVYAILRKNGVDLGKKDFLGDIK